MRELEHLLARSYPPRWVAAEADRMVGRLVLDPAFPSLLRRFAVNTGCLVMDIDEDAPTEDDVERLVAFHSAVDDALRQLSHAAQCFIDVNEPVEAIRDCVEYTNAALTPKKRSAPEGELELGDLTAEPFYSPAGYSTDVLLRVGEDEDEDEGVARKWLDVNEARKLRDFLDSWLSAADEEG